MGGADCLRPVHCTSMQREKVFPASVCGMSVLRRGSGDKGAGSRGRNRFFRGHLLHASHLVLSQLVAGHSNMRQGQGIGIWSYSIHNQAAASVSVMGTIPQSLTTLFRLVLTLPSLLPNFSSCFTISIPSTTSPKTTCFPLLVSTISVRVQGI